MNHFAYVRAHDSDVVHMTAAKLVEGNKTYCGRSFWRGWFWIRGRKPRGFTRCKKCDAATHNSVIVEWNGKYVEKGI